MANEQDQFSDQFTESRRSILKMGALASAGSVLGLSGSVAAQEDDDDSDGANGNDGDGTNAMDALMFGDEYRPGAVVRIASPPIEQLPRVDTDADVLGNRNVRVVEFANTIEEAYLFVPADAQIEVGDLYVLGEEGQWFGDDPTGENLVTITVEPLQREDFTFDVTDEVELLDEGGGEAAVRPENFYAASMFRITSEPLGWLPEDVEESGFFTDYNARHAEYLGVDDEFLFFPQEDAEIEVDGVYVMEDDFELFDPVGNLVAAEFNRVDEESIPWEDEFL